NLLAWKEPDRLLEQVVMIAATRPGYDLSRLDHLEAALRNFDRIFPIECTRVDISATAIRRRMLQRKSIRYLVPEGVREIIENRGLYRGDGSRTEGGLLKEEIRGGATGPAPGSRSSRPKARPSPTRWPPQPLAPPARCSQQT